MKLINTTLCALACSVVASNASSVFINNLNAGDEFAILSNGIALTEGQGSIGIGTYGAGVTPVINSVDDVLTGFTQFGSEVALNPVSGFGLDEGYFTNTISGVAIDGSNGFAGNNIFFVIGDGATLASSSSYAVYDAGTAFQADAGSLDDTSTGSLGNDAGSVIFGDVVSYTPSTVNANAGVTATQGLQLTSVPEPSTGFLAAFSSLALVARRRRKNS